MSNEAPINGAGSAGRVMTRAEHIISCRDHLEAASIMLRAAPEQFKSDGSLLSSCQAISKSSFHINTSC